MASSIAGPGGAAACVVTASLKSNMSSPQINTTVFSPFSLVKPSWVVKTESNVCKEEARKPQPPCSLCRGIGRVDCYVCHGKGRTNCVHLVMLPRGEWPKWCKTCGGSGLGYCDRCLGTGEYREIMGFNCKKKF